MRACGVGDCLPDCPSIEAAVAVYHSLCNRKGISYAELAKTAGVAGIQIQPIHVTETDLLALPGAPCKRPAAALAAAAAQARSAPSPRPRRRWRAGLLPATASDVRVDVTG